MDLFDVSGFNSKQVCGADWSTGLLLAYGISNALSFLTYQIFPILVWVFLYPRHLRSAKPALRALIIFVMTCGLTHLFEMLTIWWPAYRVVTLVHIVNNITSIFGLVLLVVAIRRLKYVPIRADLENELETLQNSMKNIRSSANTLAATVGIQAAVTRIKQAQVALDSLSFRTNL